MRKERRERAERETYLDDDETSTRAVSSSKVDVGLPVGDVKAVDLGLGSAGEGESASESGSDEGLHGVSTGDVERTIRYTPSDQCHLASGNVRLYIPRCRSRLQD